MSLNTLKRIILLFKGRKEAMNDSRYCIKKTNMITYNEINVQKEK